MRKVTEKTFKTYAKEAVKELNTLELTATLYFSCMGAEITLYREKNALVGRISISFDGSVVAKDWARNENFDIEPLRNTMKDLFRAVYEAVNGRLDDNGFKAEEGCELTDEQIVNIAGRLYAGGWTMLDVDMIAEKTGTNKKTAHRIMIQISMYINHTLPEDVPQESKEPVQQEAIPLTVTLHPEDEEEEITITYEDAKGFHHAVGQEALEIEKSTDGISIDKDHVYIVIEFLDGSEATFRRSSVVRIAEEGHVLLERDPEPTPEDADKELTYDDFTPESDCTEDEAKVENSFNDIEAYLECNIMNFYEDAKKRRNIDVDGKFIGCKGQDNTLKIFWEVNGIKYVLKINNYEHFTPIQIFDFWVDDCGELADSEEIAEVVSCKQGNKLGTDIGLELLEQQLTQLEKLEEESDKADDAWDKAPMNAELEAASSKAYEKEWKKYMDTVRTLGKLINIDTKTARQMLQRGKNRDKVWSYLKRSKAWNNKK